VHIVLDSTDEPNVTLGAAPCVLTATLTCDSLTPGQSYALLRYNDYLTVPSLSFTPSGASSAVYFTATATTHTLTDTFMSDTAVFYRCIPYAVTGMQQVADNNNRVNIYPNPSKGNFSIETYFTEKQTMQMYDINGNLVLSQTITGKTNIDVANLNEGVYNISIISKGGVLNKKLVIVW
jgi:CRISPR/Cas system-associated protein endoribonuclease Cas2